MNTASTPKSGENVWIWLIKILTGPLLFVLLGIHLIVNHLLGKEGVLRYAEVIAYYQNPIIPIMEILFLATVVTHSLIGLRSIILDLKPSRSTLKILDLLFLLAGISAFIYGTRLILIIAAVQ
jgi:succinate dehydrogenase / fumarate reductase membrane anchor subunit